MEKKGKRPFRNRDIPNRFYTTQAEWERIGRKAEKAGMSRSTFIRYCTQRAVVQPRLSSEEMVLYKHLIRIGETLHYLEQLARSRDDLDLGERITGSVKRLEKWMKALHRDW